MLGKLFKQVTNVLGSGPYRLVLERREDRVELAALRGGSAVSFASLPERNGPVADLKRLLTPTASRAVVPLARLPELRQALRDMQDEGPEVSIAPEVERLRPISMPEGFAVAYTWDA